MNINPTPKERFLQSSDNVSKHKKLVDQPEFQRASDFAILEYSAILAKQVTGQGEAMASGLKLLGAHEFLKVMRNISEISTAAPSIVRPDNLNHAV